MLKGAILICVLCVTSFCYAQSPGRWLAANDWDVKCGGHGAVYYVQVFEKDVFSIYGLPFVGDSQVKKYENCNAAVAQAKFDKKLVYIDLETGDVKPEDGYFYRQK